jgi:hypothetical protein
MAALRWAVNSARWSPEGDGAGPEFAFLLELLDQDSSARVMKFARLEDRKRSLLSQLLQVAS